MTAHYRRAVRKGRRMLAGETVDPLPIAIAALAARQAAEEASKGPLAIAELKLQLDASVHCSESEEWCWRILARRMEVYAAQTAIHAAYLADARQSAAAEIETLLDAVDHYDRALEMALPAIRSRLAGTRYIANQRATLASGQELPYWLEDSR
jgi:hypothetical protein